MTIRHLMTSTSRLKRLYNQADDGDKRITTQELVDFFAAKQPRLSFSPGAKFQSSVAGYCLLAGVVEKVSGQTFGQFLEESIFTPLQMRHTFLLTEATWDLPCAISYDRHNREKEWYLGSYSGGIGIYASGEDLLAWDQALYGSTLVSPTTLKEAYTSLRLSDGSLSPLTLGGWMRWQGKENQFFKNGDWVANHSLLFRDIATNTTLILLTNRQNEVSKFELMDFILPMLGYE